MSMWEWKEIQEVLREIGVIGAGFDRANLKLF